MKLLFLLLFAMPLSAQSVRVVYSYDRLQYDSLLIIVQQQSKTIHDKNYRLTHTNIDSTKTIFMGIPTDTFEVIIRAYKKDLYCIPFIDKLVYPYFRISYGFTGFECFKLNSI